MQVVEQVQAQEVALGLAGIHRTSPTTGPSAIFLLKAKRVGARLFDAELFWQRGGLSQKPWLPTERGNFWVLQSISPSNKARMCVSPSLKINHIASMDVADDQQA